MSKYLDGSGVNYLWNRIKGTFSLATHTHPAATPTLSGLMPAADKQKLDGVAAGANAYAHPASNATGAYGQTEAQTPDFGGVFTVPSFTVDGQGHLSAAGSHTVALPARPGAGGGLASYQNELGLKVTKHLNVWNQIRAGLESCYWTWVMRVDDKLASPLGRYYMWYSTDHAGAASQYIGLAYSDSLTGGWTRYGDVFHHYSEAEGAYVGDETPSVIWDAENRRFVMFSHANVGEGGEAQSSYRSVSTDGITWTGTTKLFTHIDPTRMPGNLHNGYFMPFSYMGQWFGYSLMGGENGGAALHWSEDGGYTWYTDHRQLGRWCLQGNSRFLFPNHCTPVTLGGVDYLLGIQSNFAYGSLAKTARIALVPLADLRTPFGKPYVVLEPGAGDSAYESENLRTLTVYCEGGKVYAYYNCKVGNDWYNNCAVIEPAETARDALSASPTLYFVAQPSGATATVGAVSGSLTAGAVATDGSAVSYQWYQSASHSASGGAAISGATDASMALDTALDAGAYYYYCVASSPTLGTATSGVATVTVSAADAGQTTRLAGYTLAGTAGATAPATLADDTGNGNALTVTGVTTYGENGYLSFASAGQHLSAASLSLGAGTSVRLHVKTYSASGPNGQNRLLVIPGVGLNLMIAKAAGDGSHVNFKAEDAGGAVYQPTNGIGGAGNASAYVTAFRHCTFDITISDTALRVTETISFATGDEAVTETHTFNYAGALSALRSGGLYLLNRADGARAWGGELRECWMEAVSE